MTEQEKETVIYSYYGNGSSGKNNLTKLVDGMLTPFGGISADHTDFYSVANETFARCLENYDASMGAGFDTYLSRCLLNKIKTQFSYNNRDKRKNKDINGNFIQDESLDRIIGTDEHSGDTTVGALIEDKKQNTENSVTERMGKVNEYIDSLQTPTQKKIAECWVDGLSHTETRERMGLSVGDYNRVFNEMKSYDKIKILRRGVRESNFIKSTKLNNTYNEQLKKESTGMQVAKTSSNADKSKLEGLTTAQLINDLDNVKVLTNHPLQRESDQWTNEYKGNLITTILNNYKFSPIVVCQEYKNDQPYNWLIDGKQRATTIYEYRHDLFKVSKKSMHTVMTYQVNKKDENGKILKDEDGRPLYELQTFDVANKKFSELPAELQEIFDYYLVSIERYLNCTEDEVQYHIIRYNNAKPMSVSNKGTLKLGEQFAQAVKNIANKSPLFNEYKELTKLASTKKDALERIIIESIMGSFYLDKWNKSHDANCEFLASNGNASDFDEFAALTDTMTQVIDETTGKLLTQRNAFIWISVFNNFVGMMEDDSNLTFDDFNRFMVKFPELVTDELSALDEKGSKDKVVVVSKITIITELLRAFLGGDDGTKQPVEKVEDVDSINIEETHSKEDVTEAENGPVAEFETEVEEVIEEEIESLVESNSEPVTMELEEVEEPIETEIVEEENEEDKQEDSEVDSAIFDYIDAFADSEIVRKLNVSEKEVNKAAVITAMMFDCEKELKKLDDESIHEYVQSKDFTTVEPKDEFLEKANEWSALAIGNNAFVNIQNLPVILCLTKYAKDNGYDSAKCKNWFETFAFTFGSKGLEEKDYYGILKAAIEDMKRNCANKPQLVF